MAKDGKFAVKSGGGEKGKAEGAIKEVSELLDKLVTAVKTAEGASSGTAAIGEVVANAGAAKAADKASVTGIAKGIKEIVEAAGGSSEKLKAVAAAKGENNKGAGKLFGKAGAGNAGDSEAATTLTNRKSFGFNPSHLTLYSLNRYFYYLNKHKAIDSELKIEITKLKVNCDYIVLRYSLNATH
ncbi:variable large family protein [Borreliella burgdorferi]|uniref:variable large family protein n=1 Tax=Borreliella burgdorferi TaxID=139 RepID=UPI003A0FFE22